MGSSLCAVADAATRDADASNTKEDHLRAFNAHTKAAEHAKETNDDKLARKHSKQAKEHKAALRTAESASSDSSEKGNPLSLWAGSKGG